MFLPDRATDSDEQSDDYPAKKWKPRSETKTFGITFTKTEEGRGQVEDVDKSVKWRNLLQDFLTTIGTYAPDNFINTILEESTSYEWIIEKISEVFQLSNRGKLH